MNYEQDLGNLVNYTAMPLIENYDALWYEAVETEDDNSFEYPNEPIPFKYSDGTSDSYVKRGYDEEEVQRLTRMYGLESNYRIFTTNTTIAYKPYDQIIIGDDTKTIVKVLPLLNTNDNIRMYNFAPSLYRRMAVKLIYLE